MDFCQSRGFNTKPTHAALRCTPSLAAVASALCLLGALTACGEKLTNTFVPESCTQGNEALGLSQAPHFVTRQFKGVGTEGATVLYRLDTLTMEAKPIIITGSASTDALPFRDAAGNQMFFLERFIGGPSRLTRISCNPTGKALEKGNLPENTFAMGYVNSTQIAALGWNSPTMLVFPEDFGPNSDSASDVSIATPTHGLTEADTHINNLLVAGQQKYLVSSGYSFGSGQPTQARLYKMNSALSAVEVVYEISNCSNAYQDYTLQLSAHQVALGCNPQYAGPDPDQNATLVLVTVFENAEPEFTVLTGPGSDAQMIVPAGVSSDGQSLFVAEYTTSSAEPALIPGRPLRSYWLDLATNNRTALSGISGSAIYDPILKKYVFSCVVSPADGLCKDKVFGWADATIEEAAPGISERKVSYDYDFWQFERKLF
jgi:hypothetical protein